MILLSVMLTAVSMVAPDGAVRKGPAVFRQIPQRDSMLIGDRLQYGALLEKVEEGTEFTNPDLGAMSDSVEILRDWYIDTLRVYKAKKGVNASYDLELKTELTSFEEGRYMLPAISMLAKGPAGNIDTLIYEAMEVEVKTIPVDTASYIPHDIRGQIRYPVTFKEIAPYILIALLLTVLGALLVWYVRLRHGRKQERIVAEEAPHIVALRKLDAYRGNKYWAADKQKQFYSGVTDALREYIAARYAFGAQEMTTAEIFYELKSRDLSVEMYSEMKELFENSDFVKFAKMTLPDEDNANVLPRSIRFVTETYQAILDAEAAEANEGVAEEN